MFGDVMDGGRVSSGEGVVDGMERTRGTRSRDRTLLMVLLNGLNLLLAGEAGEGREHTGPGRVSDGMGMGAVAVAYVDSADMVHGFTNPLFHGDRGGGGMATGEDAMGRAVVMPGDAPPCWSSCVRNVWCS